MIRHLRLAAILLCLALPLAGYPVRAADAPADDITAEQKEVEEAAREAGASGLRAEQWAQERDVLLNEARQLIYDTEATRFAVSRQEAYIRREQADITELSKRLATAQATRQGLEPLMEALYSELADALSQGLPFALDEREARLGRVRRTLDDPDASAGAKLGQLLEALRMEAGYGLDMEVEDAIMTVDGAPASMTLLRVGRLALLRLSRSGDQVERFDPESRTWSRLPGDSARDVAKAVEIVNKRRMAELVFLPVGTPARLAPAGKDAR